MSEQSDYRMAAFDDLIDKCTKGTKVGNSYLRSFLKQGIEEYKFADFAHTLPGKDAFPLEEHYSQYQDPDAPLPIWRPPILINCKHHDLTEDECSGLLECCADPFCSAKTSSRSASSKILTTLLRAKKIYLSFFTPNLGKVNRNHALEVT